MFEPSVSNQIQEFVAAHKDNLKRVCWQPALDYRAADAAAPSARIVVTVTVDPNGDVQTAVPTEAPSEYPQLSNCVATVVKSWRFPTPAVVTTVRIPFVFDAK